MSEQEPTVRERVVELLNTAAFLPSEKEKIATLAKVQELIIHLDPQLLDSFFEDVAAFQKDRNSDVRKFVVGFIEEACKKDVGMLPRLVPNMQLLVMDDAISVVKRVVQAVVQLHRATLAWLAAARTTTPEMEQVWHIITIMKGTILAMIDHDNDGVRTQAIKFLEALVLLQTYTETDSVTREGEFNLDDVPLTLKVARPRKLEEESKVVLGRLLAFQGSIHISSVNLMTCMSSLTIVARARPQFLGKVVNALEILHANLPPTLTKSQVNSVRKHLKIQMLNLLKHSASYDYHYNITTVLSDLGTSSSEVRRMPTYSMNKAMPSKDIIRKRVRRDKLGEETVEKPPKKPRVEKEKKSSKMVVEEPPPPVVVVVEKNSAVDITQRWLVDKLSPENVANLVLVSMLNLPDEMPALFSAGYSPITAAGTQTQIQHVARLLSSQLTAVGQGPGAEQVPDDEQMKSGYDSDDESNISRLVGGRVQEDAVQVGLAARGDGLPCVYHSGGPVLVPAGLAGRGARHKAKTMKLEEVTKPMNAAANTKMQQILLRRLLRSHKAPLGSGAKDCLRIITILLGSISSNECEGKRMQPLESTVTLAIGRQVYAACGLLRPLDNGFDSCSLMRLELRTFCSPTNLEDFLLEDMSNNCDLLFSWLYSEYATRHDFSQVNRFLCSAGKKQEKQYAEIMNSIVMKVLAKEASKERDEYGSQGGESILTVANTLKDITQWRPPSSRPALEVLATLATHDQETVREQVIPILVELCDQESYMDTVAESATTFLKYLLLDAPPDVLCSHDLGRPVQPGEWTEPSVKACLYLHLALLPLNQSMIHDLAQVYVKTVNEAKRSILRLLEGPIRHMGMESPQLLKLVETCPKGGETLITRIIHILTEKAPPSEALVCRVRELYNRRVSDVRFLIPVLTGLSKKEVIAVLPKLIKLNPHVVKEVFNRLWGVTLDTGASPLTPVDLLVALHLIDNDKCDVKTVIKATGLCFGERNIYTAEVLAFVLQQLMEQPSLPTLFMRTVIQTLTHYPKLLGFIMNVLQRLISRQVWKQRKVWEGFIKCCQRAGAQSFTVLLQLPPPQLADVFSVAPDLRSRLLDHIATLTENQRAHIPPSLMDVIEGIVVADIALPVPHPSEVPLPPGAEVCCLVSN
ncbi:Symplekin [Chionoecetes opilio]|uniref:Symplekin n=1 Tax=Chionoecetes opilio TaxID=41210 RepID=A0A8J4XYI6_CHIOP|nr:Symplekin [Chionoecetes opilio]